MDQQRNPEPSAAALASPQENLMDPPEVETPTDLWWDADPDLWPDPEPQRSTTQTLSLEAMKALEQAVADKLRTMIPKNVETQLLGAERPLDFLTPKQWKELLELTRNPTSERHKPLLRGSDIVFRKRSPL